MECERKCEKDDKTDACLFTFAINSIQGSSMPDESGKGSAIGEKLAAGLERARDSLSDRMLELGQKKASDSALGVRARLPIDRMLAFTAALKAGQPAGALVPNIGAA